MASLKIQSMTMTSSYVSIHHNTLTHLSNLNARVHTQALDKTPDGDLFMVPN